VRPGSLVRMVAWNDAFVARLQGFAMLTVSCIRPPVAPAEVSWRLVHTSGVLSRPPLSRKSRRATTSCGVARSPQARVCTRRWGSDCG